MGKFTHLATLPARGVGDILRWRIVELLKGNRAAKDDTTGPTTRAYDKDIIASADASLVWIGHRSAWAHEGGKEENLWILDPGETRRLR